MKNIAAAFVFGLALAFFASALFVAHVLADAGWVMANIVMEARS